MNQITIEKLRDWELILSKVKKFLFFNNDNGINFKVKTIWTGSEKQLCLVVDSNGSSLSISIADGRIVENKSRLSSGQLDMAKNWVLSNKSLIENHWDEFSQGIRIIKRV